MEPSWRKLAHQEDAFEEAIETPGPSSLSSLSGYCELTAFFWSWAPHHDASPQTHSDGTEQPWTETFETVNQNKSFFL
jgi:hypothetical protein